MSCKYIPSYIDKRVFVSGKESILNTHNFVEFGILPKKGEANDILIKCTSKDYHARWDSLTNIIAPLLPTLLSGIYTFQNGLTESPAFTIEWGGSLLRNTQINGQSLYSVSFSNVNDFNVTSVDDIVLRAQQPGSVISIGTILVEITGQNGIGLKTPLYSTAPRGNGSLLQMTNQSTGYVEYTPYIFPLVDGTSGQYLTTNGTGVVGWNNPINKCEVLHFDDNPTNVTFTDDGSGFNTASTYSLSSNTLSSNGSYLEVEAIQVVTGTTGDIPKLAIAIPGLVRYLKAPLIHSFTHIAKGKIFRVSATSVYLSIEGNIYDAAGEHVTSYYEFQTAVITWNTPVTINCNFDIGVGDHISELQHFSITKFLK
jgi:hypothetical protein